MAPCQTFVTIGRPKASPRCITCHSPSCCSARKPFTASITSPASVQRCTLLSIKTGGCPEDCAYCPQSAHYETGVARDGLMDPRCGAVGRARRRADSGSTRFCMGAAWREVQDGAAFDAVIDMVRDVAALGMEVCTTLGMLTADQAQRLKSAGLTAYNHNLDTSPEFYPRIITTRTYQDRLDTLRHVQEAGLSVCCGGIVGMGESSRDRCALLAQLGRLDPHPESLPVNVLVRTAGTPLADADDLDPIELVRTVASARLVARRRACGCRPDVSRCLTKRRPCALSRAPIRFSRATSSSPRRTRRSTTIEQLMNRLGLRFQA